jgi:gliding motility-associated-like protein
LTNIANPTVNGMTISAKMFQVNNFQTACLDNSPVFLENPYLIICSGAPYKYMPNIFDADFDSLSVSLVTPLNSFTSGIFNPPTSPIETVFASGYSAFSPTPGLNINGSNQGFQVDLSNGDIAFTSVIPGEYLYKVVVKSFRNGRLISEVEREIVVFVTNCGSSNNPPVINPSAELGLDFEESYNAGVLVDFNVNSTDDEFLQDGTSPQENAISVSSGVFANPIVNSGVQGANATIQWQTNCSDLKTAYGKNFQNLDYHFVVKVTDNYCPIPMVSYERITINLSTTISADLSQLSCIQTQTNGDLELTWTAINDPLNDFVAFELHSVQDGLISSFNNINILTTILAAPNTEKDYFIKTVSGTPCAIALSSDTLSNIQLDLFNPGSGIANLSWNSPFTTNDDASKLEYELFREYPANSGNWTKIATLPYAQNQYKDTIDVCDAFLNYQVILPSGFCDFTSNIIGDQFEDKISPNIPTIFSISIDTLTGLTVVDWNTNQQDDTYGYIIYQNLPNGILLELDTVYGATNSSYSFLSQANLFPIGFSVAAFDSCFTNLNPPTFQTSAKSDLHSTMYLTTSYDICSEMLNLSWISYLGWSDLDYFEIYLKEENGFWQAQGITENQFYKLKLKGEINYQIAILAHDSLSSNTAFSNAITLYTISSSKPSFNYTRVASVNGAEIEIKHFSEAISGVRELALERKNEKEVFEEIQRLPAQQDLTFIDADVFVQAKPYEYQVRIIDSCGNVGALANMVKTIHLSVKTDHDNLTNNLTWTPYEGFKGSLLQYKVYRGVNGIFDGNIMAVLPPNQLYYYDTAQVYDTDFNGKICYLVDAVESYNIYGFFEVSHSNIACPVFKPIIYIPNAFSPNGDEFNSVFKPVVSLSDINDYALTIFDRWGQVIFRTNEIQEGWDGTLNISGKLAPLGTYIYVVELKDGDNQEHIRRGHLSLVR